MRLCTAWWGCVLIPETLLDVSAIDKLPEKAEKKYEEGTVEQIRDQESFEWDYGIIDLPMKRAAVITR